MLNENTCAMRIVILYGTIDGYEKKIYNLDWEITENDITIQSHNIHNHRTKITEKTKVVVIEADCITTKKEKRNGCNPVILRAKVCSIETWSIRDNQNMDIKRVRRSDGRSHKEEKMFKRTNYYRLLYTQTEKKHF